MNPIPCQAAPVWTGQSGAEAVAAPLDQSNQDGNASKGRYCPG